jgi:insertion element IS1 protein InsB
MIIFVLKTVDMEHYQKILCSHCSAADLYKDGNFWSFVQNKSNHFLILWKPLEVFSISCYRTDGWGFYYSKYIPASMHRTGKDNIWKIERKNLNFRTHIKRLNRKTICFSKNEQIHDNVIGMYIETFYYKTGTYENN